MKFETRPGPGGRHSEGREPNAATPAQRRYLRRLLGRYVSRVGGPDAAGGKAFSRPLDAVAYALAREVLSHRERMPRSKNDAHDWISVLAQPEDAEQGVLRVFELARRRGERYSEWRRAALSPLAILYGYPGPGWLDCLNKAIQERFEAVEDEGERERLLRQPPDFRTTVVDPCFRPPDAEDGSEARGAS